MERSDITYLDYPSCFIESHEVSEQKESDTPNQFKNCTKNRGHSGFIPVDAFNLHHLPERYQTSIIFDCIKSLAQMTVRTSTVYISPNRPDSYPFSDKRDKFTTAFGTGRIDKLIWHKGLDGTHCPCPRCEQSENPSKLWMEVLIMTARHVVFDDSEAKRTSCRLFYDREDSEMCRLEGIKVDYEDMEKDRCLFKSATCDDTLMKKLDSLIKDFKERWKKAHFKYRNLDVKNKLVCIVSHPHGYLKIISIGLSVGMKKSDKVWCQFLYSTPTCTGSSGAAVFVLGHAENFFYQHIHSYSIDGLYYSGLAWSFRKWPL